MELRVGDFISLGFLSCGLHTFHYIQLELHYFLWQLNVEHTIAIIANLYLKPMNFKEKVIGSWYLYCYHYLIMNHKLLLLLLLKQNYYYYILLVL